MGKALTFMNSQFVYYLKEQIWDFDDATYVLRKISLGDNWVRSN